MDPNIVSKAAEGGVAGLLALAVTALVLAGARGWIVFKVNVDAANLRWQAQLDEQGRRWQAQLDERERVVTYLREDRDEWRQLALGKAEVLEQSVEVAQRAARRK